MPLLLDNGLPMQIDGVGDVDDLFGDGTGGLPMRQPTKQIDLRLDQLRNRGCFRTVAWSKVGTIASITPDGQELEIRFLRCQPSDGEWDLSEPTVCGLVRGTPEDPLVHLEWSETNNPELAVFDSAGRLALLIFSNTLNQPFMVKRWDSEPVDDSQAVVGCYWLPANLSTTGMGDKATRQSYNVLFGPASKTERGNYHYTSSFVHAESPAHPQTGRSALLTVTTGGILKMVWMQVNNRPEETRLELESIGSADELITHAALASEKSA
ncbi:hypothetical protein GMORB2_6122 [Geosmithia morbida]|uniref:Mediator of RNA polymerase II transcription subunit 16 n=1 Tax=Geosmithia morbida TaxID=1094350 RepID=A0A9P5D4D6_9HYPO|nr:uncharacterized protein GMORB2_6122 [Geosmithia morbida]KAF4123421.1 hypothetical protein GMORB2_6122 [Geosmithia morbida]